MNDIARNGNAVMAAETGKVRGRNPVRTDLVMKGMDIQLSPSLQDGPKETANARAKAYRDRILEAAGRSKVTA